jgi:hypothetical protein
LRELVTSLLDVLGLLLLAAGAVFAAWPFVGGAALAGGGLLVLVGSWWAARPPRRRGGER